MKKGTLSDRTASTLCLRSPEGPVPEAECLYLRPCLQQLSTHASDHQGYAKPLRVTGRGDHG